MQQVAQGEGGRDATMSAGQSSSLDIIFYVFLRSSFFYPDACFQVKKKKKHLQDLSQVLLRFLFI